VETGIHTTLADHEQVRQLAGGQETMNNPGSLKVKLALHACCFASGDEIGSDHRWRHRRGSPASEPAGSGKARKPIAPEMSVMKRSFQERGVNDVDAVHHGVQALRKVQGKALGVCGMGRPIETDRECA